MSKHDKKEWYSIQKTTLLSKIPLLGFYGLLFILHYFLIGCNPDKIQTLEKKFPLAAWKQDRGACKDTRLGTINLLKTEKEIIKGLTINEITELFGKPDQQLLTNRQQKYYIYFLESGTHCQDIRVESNARSVAFRFSALGIVTEVTFQQGQP